MESVTPPGHSIFQTWFTILFQREQLQKAADITPASKSTKSCYKRSRVDRTIIESRMTRTVNKNPPVYKISRGGKDGRYNSLD